MKKETRPDIFIAWRHKRTNRWEALERDQLDAFLEKLLLKDGVNPASVFISTLTMATRWLYAPAHNGSGMFDLSKIYKDINGTSNPSDYSGPKVEHKPKPSKTKYGYVSPDGRYFHCEYEGHYSLAKKIVGELVDIQNPQKHLEDNGWLCIYNDPHNHGTYSVYMAFGKRMTDSQHKTLESLGIPSTCRGYKGCLLGENI